MKDTSWWGRALLVFMMVFPALWFVGNLYLFGSWLKERIAGWKPTGPLCYRATYAAPDPSTDERRLLAEAWVDAEGRLLRAAGASGHSRTPRTRAPLGDLPAPQVEALKTLAHLEIDEMIVMLEGSQRQWSHGSTTASNAGSDSYRIPVHDQEVRSHETSGLRVYPGLRSIYRAEIEKALHATLTEPREFASLLQQMTSEPGSLTRLRLLCSGGKRAPSGSTIEQRASELPPLMKSAPRRS